MASPRHYGDLIDGLVSDQGTAPGEPTLSGVVLRQTDTMMSDAPGRARLAREALDFSQAAFGIEGSAMPTAAILPVKRFSQAKQRLQPALGAGSRTALAAAMFADVLAALRHASLIDTILLVSGRVDGPRTWRSSPR